MSEYAIELPDRLTEQEFAAIAREADTLLDVQREARLTSSDKTDAEGAGNRNVTREALNERGLLDGLRAARSESSPQERLQALGLKPEADDGDTGGETA